jgi:hypothetical protein
MNKAKLEDLRRKSAGARDTGGEYEAAKFHYGGPFRCAVLGGALDPYAAHRAQGRVTHRNTERLQICQWGFARGIGLQPLPPRRPLSPSRSRTASDGYFTRTKYTL